MTERSSHITPAEAVFQRKPEQLAQTEHLVKAGRFLAKAKNEELPRIDASEGKEATERVINGLEKRFVPWVVENEKISEQIYSEKYQTYMGYVSRFIKTDVGGAQCSDGRIYNGAIFDPLVAVLDKRPQGMFATKISGKDGSYVLKDHSIPSAISSHVKTFDIKRSNEQVEEKFEQMEVFGNKITDINSIIKAALREERTQDDFAFSPSVINPKEEDFHTRDKKQTPQIVEFPGPHIDSVHPLHGCGAATAKGTQDGTPADEAMKLGGIDLYFDELQDGFFAFDNNVRKAGGKGATFDTIHDSHSQGLIFGARQAYLNGWLDSVDSPEALRPTMEKLHFEGKLLMTELLDKQLNSKMERVKTKLHEGLDIPQELDLTNLDNYADNMILTGLIAKGITENYEDEDPNFSWIPEHIKDEKTQEATRTLAYTAIRNSVYRNLNNIVPGEHDLVDHPEQVVRAGSTGAAYNVNTKGFIHVTPQGRFREKDRAEIDKLKGLARKFMPQLPDDLKADFQKEALVIITTGKFDKEIYESDNDEDEKKKLKKALSKIKDFEAEASTVRGNASDLRDIYSNEVKSGKVVVVGVMFNGKREITHVLSSDSVNDNVDE